ncbi:MAG: LytTR family DNA-binding domain-containing protein [Clostridia bacterium]|nr:LytTR family DNA-binding domain-containing protein [Clostridia bacterium]
MYQAAIVEDECEILSYLKNTLINSFNKRHVSIAFDSFSSGEDFLHTFNGHYHYDVIFLDIEMPGIDGIQVCRKIRQQSPDTLVIFISNKEELVFQTFEVQPFRFIRKSEYQKLLPALADAVTQKLGEQTKHSIFITEPGSGDIFSFDIRMILYIEAQRKNCLIVTASGTSTVQCKISDMEESLIAHGFIKIHRSYLVNCRHIFYIGKTSLQLTNGQELPVSRGKVEEVKEGFRRFYV